MKRILATLVATLIAATALPAQPATAAAYPDATATVDVTSTHLPTDGCITHEYVVTITPNAEARSWSADVTVEGPGGQYVDSDYFYGYGASVEYGSILLCSHMDDPGLYSIDVDLETTDRTYNTWPSYGALEFFTVRKQTPRVAARLSDTTPRHGQVVTVSVRAWAPIGRDPIAYGTIVMQRRERGRWITYGWSKTTLDGRGRARIKGRALATRTLRVRLIGDVSYRAAKSRPVTMRIGG